MPTNPDYSTLVERLRKARHRVSDEGRPDAVAAQHARGKATARERIAMLTDPGSFREFGALVGAHRGTAAGAGLDAPADGVVTGTAVVDGRPLVVASFDFTVFGGSNGVAGMLKLNRCIERALHDGTPLILLMDGGGHRIQEGLDSHHFAWGSDAFHRMSDLCGWVPIISVMLGPGFAGPSTLAAFSDFVVLVRGVSTMGVAGPALVRAATGEQLTGEELGGADRQAGNGIADLAVDTEQEALDAVRVVLGYLPSNSAQPAFAFDGAWAESPGAAAIADLVPTDRRSGYDVRAVIAALVDADTAFELKPAYAPNIVTSLARVGGRPVGVIANQPQHLGGVLDSAACEKAAHFVALCDCYSVALLFLIDVPGFLIGTAAESAQLARRSGRLLFELGQATVPRFSVVLRKGYGGGYLAMCGGRSFAADLALAWPTAEICAMSVEGAVDVAFRREVAAAPDPAARRVELVAGFRARIDPLLAAEGFGVDDVVEPGETRELLLAALARAGDRHPNRGPAKRRTISPI